MKAQMLLILSFVIIFIAIFEGCEKFESKNLDVEHYIHQLKSNQYESQDLPAFIPSDIPALLNYRNENQIITNFPHNPISSLYGPDCKLGIYVLWTIESIRAVSVESKFLIKRFPSQNPILAERFADELKLVNDQESHEIAAQAYYSWWYSNMNFDKIKHIDPLGNTNYKWH